MFEAVLEHSPARESTLVSAAELAGTLNRSGRAVALWRRAIAVDPWRSDYYADLAQQLVERGRVAGSTRCLGPGASSQPRQSHCRIAQIVATFRSGSPQDARALFDTLLEFDPPDREDLKRWFEQLK